ncbi:hypothetical protein [Amycolatopsis sp. NPDC051102]|uniref:hypothetical protein n=1 Tax=Amycolatopsis sp. NPDC051102 TaxID=3155163 RepID=UPI00343780EF
MTATTQDLEAARLLLSRLGVDPADLIGDTTADRSDDERPPMPMLSYGSYWKKAEARWGERPMDTITATEIKAMAEHV